MSQSAENQSAIIENENNFNIAVESLAAESEPSHADLNLDSLCNAEAEPSTPVQDEMEEGMDVGEGHENALNIGEFAVGDDAGEEFSSGAGDAELKSDDTQNPAEETGLSRLAGEPSGAQGVSELQVPFFPAEGEDHDVDTGTMDVDQPEPGEDQQVEGRGEGYSEPTSTDDVQDFDSGQHNADEDVGSELADSQAEPLHYEADSDNHLAAAPDSSRDVEGDQNNSVHMEEGGVQLSETLDEDQNLPMGDAGQPVENATPDEDQNLTTTYGEEQEGKCESSEYQNVEGEDTEGKQDETGICDVHSMEDTEEQLDESEVHGYQNQPMEETEGQQDASGIPDYQNQAMEETGQQSESGIFDSDQNLSVENIDGQQDESGLPDEDPTLAEQYSATQEDENETACAQDKTVEGTEQDKQVESEGPESDQLLQMQNTEQDQQIESARTEDDQDVAIDEPEQGQNAVTVDDQHLPEEGGQDEQQADAGNGKDVDDQQLESSVTEDTQGIRTDIEMADCEAEVKDEVSGNEEGSAAVASVSESSDLECGNIESEENTTTGGDASGDVEKTGLDQDANETSIFSAAISESKSSDGLDKLLEEGDQAMDAEGDRASDATIVEGRDIDDEPMLQVTDIKSGAEAEEGLDERQESMGDDNADDGNSDPSVASKTADSKAAGEVNNHIEEAGMADTPSSKTAAGKADGEKKSQADDDDDVVVLDDDEAAFPEVKKGLKKEVLNSNNDMGIQIESVSGRANDVHGYNEQTSVKQDNADQKPVQNSTAPKMESKSSAPPVKKSSRTQTCIVCKKVGKCKYNIVRNGDIKHLCDNTCFKRFRANPTLFLKGAGAPSNAPAANKKGADVKAPPGAPGNQGLGKASVPGYKTCTVCMVMNINAQGQFCVWKGLDFCGEGCLGKFQSGISSSCALCTAFIPLAQRSTHCLRIGSQMRPFCSNRCYADYKLRLRLCTQCQKDAASAPDTFFSAPMGSDRIFKDFCSQACMKTFEELLNTDVEIIRVPPGKPRSINKCSVCQKKELIKHIIKYKGTVHNLCTDPCLSAFQYANKLDMNTCDFCSTLCTSRESSLHTVQFEGHQKRFCSETCVTKFRLNNRKVSPCSWCGTQRDNFDMIERLDSSSKYQLFCSLNCLSLYRVNLQAKSNQPVTCDQCSKRAPAQYHLTMSDASVRNFCSYNCVMTFQAQFSKGPTAPPATSAASAPPPTPPPPKHKHNTRGRAGRGRQQQSPATSPSFPIISNVISLAPQGGQQQVNIKNSSGMPVVVSGANQTVKTMSVTSQAPVQQQIIIQPPPPKPVKNKSLLCKPFVQTKATSCRPHTQSKECQTDEIKQKPALVPVPVPVYLPAPMALYSAPAPTPIFVPIPIPVPIFIPTTRKSANGILKQIKEIREKTPSDPLEAELLMMAAAVSADGKNSSDSESEEEMLPEINKPRKRMLQADDDDDADVMPLTTNKEEEGGEEDMISMALRMAEEMSGPITDLESAVEAVPVNTEPPPQPPRSITPDSIAHEEEMIRNRRGGKRGGTARRGGTGRPAKRPRIQVPQPEPVPMRQEPPPPPPPPADANYHLKFTYGVNAWRHWVLFKNNQIERTMKPGCGRVKLFKTDIMQCTADELNFSLCLFVKEVRKPNGDEYSPDSIYYLCLGIQQYLFENGRIDNIFTDFYYERFTECLTQILSNCQPKFNASGQMVCRIEEEHLWECKQLGAHSPYVLLNTLIYFHTKYFMLKTPEDHMKLSFAHILKYWKKGQPGKGGQPARSVSLRYYSVSTAKKDGSAPTSATKKGSKDGIPVYEVTENQENPLRCPVKLYEFYLSKCPESIKNRSDIFYPVPERSCVPDSPVWYSTTPISLEVMTKMLTRILLVREIQEAHLHAQPIYV